MKRVRSHDLGVLNLCLELIDRGSSFSVSAVPRRFEDSSLNSVAFKKPIPPGRDEDDGRIRRRIHDIMLELRVLCHKSICKQENIVKLLGITWEADPYDLRRRWPVLLLERAAHGTLLDYIRDFCPLSFENKVDISLDVSLGLDTLHKCGVFHGDMKVQNVLIFDSEEAGQQNGRSFIAKLADFGGALHDVQRRTYLPTPTKLWAAPEWESGLGPSQLPKADVYSLGFVIWHVFTDGRHPFSDPTLKAENFDLATAERLSEEVKGSDAKLFAHLSLFELPHQANERLVLETIFEKTVCVNPDERKLFKTLEILQEASKIPR